VQRLAHGRGADFLEFVLVLDDRALLARLEPRAAQPNRAERVNARLVSTGEVPELVRSMELLLAQRPSAISIDATGTPVETDGLSYARICPSTTEQGASSRDHIPRYVPQPSDHRRELTR
jgi:hypothetical protein